VVPNAKVKWLPHSEPPGWKASEIHLVYDAEELPLVASELVASIRLLLSQDLAGAQGLKPPLFYMAGLLLSLVRADIEHRGGIFTSHPMRRRIVAVLDDTDSLARTLKKRRVLPEEDTNWGRDWSQFNEAFLQKDRTLA
jgi:hypothetical protein